MPISHLPGQTGRTQEIGATAAVLPTSRGAWTNRTRATHAQGVPHAGGPLPAMMPTASALAMRSASGTCENCALIFYAVRS